ncbi:endonuclease/exonuclease/phosphatase family protein [Pseudooceanicola batsensis HTCC2597]|uniref:Endonuclease/exonuclease/phosphatase family protein n=1 Tax=Pseudooceanicola batsensis (strain ATCC BAA-863 / DSM 15984 / KCTC 12145 / HTCC2597) TaxID=252305 RepID=A3TYU7_PSEBH|nr:endonuclease/exonuclease/phosphatase family protein [Pseudooceanicola batsensis]EAQ02765.1 endonuclease/exonuclease/phosphatase family protein [Pseudooceanicola batsensis HTCC2597]
MRLASYNIEWFDALFDDDGALLIDDRWSARRDVTRAEQARAIATVLRAVDADAVMLIEAPDTSGRRSTVRALETFAASFDLRTRRAVIGFPNRTQQEIALLFDPETMAAHHDPGGRPDDAEAPRFDGRFRIDLDVDASRDTVVFSKPPLELMVTLPGGAALRLLGVHLKSKAPHGARTRDEIMRLAIANRRKQLAQAIWLRRRVAGHLAAGEPLIVMGDLNDGPGLDEYENLFGRSSVEIVLGDEAPRLYDPHVDQALAARLTAAPTTARFHIQPDDRYLQALLDYIMISPDLMSHNPRWRIWHPFDDPGCWSRPQLRDALITASDHFPVVLDIDL